MTRASSGGVGLRSLAAVYAAAIAGAGVLQLTGSPAFGPYFGPISPVGGTALVAALGFAALRFLTAMDTVRLDRPDAGAARFVTPAAMATALAVPVVLADLAGGFPPDINVLPPQGFLFYPVIAVVAETVFHLLPLALLMFVGSRLLPRAGGDRLLTAALLLVALPEPVFQVLAGAGRGPAWADAYVGVQLVVFNLLAVLWLRRFGFFAMLSFRLVYYLWWHLAWGALRLRILF